MAGSGTYRCQAEFIVEIEDMIVASKIVKIIEMMDL